METTADLAGGYLGLGWFWIGGLLGMVLYMVGLLLWQLFGVGTKHDPDDS